MSNPLGAHCHHDYLKEPGLETSESTSNSQVKGLPCVNRQRFILVRFHQLGHGFSYVGVCDGWKLQQEWSRCDDDEENKREKNALSYEQKRRLIRQSYRSFFQLQNTELTRALNIVCTPAGAGFITGFTQSMTYVRTAATKKGYGWVVFTVEMCSMQIFYQDYF